MFMSSAKARARAVLPVPGGPYSIHPRFHGMPFSRYHSRLFRHNSISWIRFLIRCGKIRLSSALPFIVGRLPRSSGACPSRRYVPCWYHARPLLPESLSVSESPRLGTWWMMNRVFDCWSASSAAHEIELRTSHASCRIFSTFRVPRMKVRVE